jgi:hypothetical protein
VGRANEEAEWLRIATADPAFFLKDDDRWAR